MRKILVASQKGGVGKTTTSINLAAAAALAGKRVLLLDADPLGGVTTALHLEEHPRRRPLRESGIDLNGTLCRDVLPGLDVISPYREGSADGEDLENLLAQLGSDHFAKTYHCTIFDAPPFMGLRPRNLLTCADEYILVMRAEAGAFRTLPMFLETVKTIQHEDGPIVLRGVLLTQPQEQRWESDLRRYLGDKALPNTIPFDDEIVKAAGHGTTVMTAQPDSVAAQGYAVLAGNLGLIAGDEHPVPKLAERPAAATVPVPAVVAAPTGGAVGKIASSLAEPEPVAVRTARPIRPAHVAAEAETPRLTHFAEAPRTPAIPRRRPVPFRKAEKAVKPAQRPAATAIKEAMPPPPPARKLKLRPWHLLIGGATGFGAISGMVRSSELILPMAVGLATAAGMVVVLKLAMKSNDRK